MSGSRSLVSASRIGLSAATFAVSLTAQRTWIVDPEGRPGHDFTDLPPAIAASASGDTIQVRGSSSRRLTFTATTSKGLTIIGDGHGHIINGNLAIVGLPAGRRFVLRDLGPFPLGQGLWMWTSIALQSCRGSVHVQNLRCQPNQVNPLFSYSELRISITDCRDVTLRGCETVGEGGGVRATRSCVLATDCVFGGVAQMYQQQRWV